MKKLVNQIINEIFRQLTLTLTLELDVPVCPMDAKGLIRDPFIDIVVQIWIANSIGIILFYIKLSFYSANVGQKSQLDNQLGHGNLILPSLSWQQK